MPRFLVDLVVVAAVLVDPGLDRHDVAPGQAATDAAGRGPGPIAAVALGAIPEAGPDRGVMTGITEDLIDGSSRGDEAEEDSKDRTISPDLDSRGVVAEAVVVADTGIIEISGDVDGITSTGAVEIAEMVVEEEGSSGVEAIITTIGPDIERIAGPGVTLIRLIVRALQSKTSKGRSCQMRPAKRRRSKIKQHIAHKTICVRSICVR